MSANINYPNIIEKGLAKIEDLLVQEAELFLQKNYLISRRSLALLIIQEDREIIIDLQKYLPSISPIERPLRQSPISGVSGLGKDSNT
ncbi:MAG: hypothetical protein Kow0091_30610 [Geminocystis sp.]